MKALFRKIGIELGFIPKNLTEKEELQIAKNFKKTTEECEKWCYKKRNSKFIKFLASEKEWMIVQVMAH